MKYAIFLLFTFLVFMFYQWQYFMVFTPTYSRDDELKENMKTLSLTTDDNIKLEGVVFEPKKFSSTLLFFGGNAHDSVGLINKLSQTFSNTRIITFNYHSYGKSEGSVSEKNMLNDALNIAQIVKKDYGDFYILGFSLGSIVASYVASKQQNLGVFLVGTFDSLSNLAKKKYGINLSWILRYKFNNIEFVKNIDAKTYIFSTKNDEITYIENARNLKKYVKNLVLYKELDNMLHNDLFFNEEVVSDIKKVLK